MFNCYLFFRLICYFIIILPEKRLYSFFPIGIKLCFPLEILVSRQENEGRIERRMSGWMNEWIEGWTNWWLDWWMNELIIEWMNWWMDRWIDDWMDELMNGRNDEWMNEWKDHHHQFHYFQIIIWNNLFQNSFNSI